MRKKTIIKIVMLTVLVLVLETFLPSTVFALQDRTYNFSKPTLTGVGATDMVQIAQDQNNRTQNQMGYTEAWCADFVSDCARIAGQSRAIPPNGSAGQMYDEVIRSGGYVVNTAKGGDLVFYKNTSLNRWMHVGIMIDANTAISGNYWRNDVSRVTTHGYNQYRDRYGTQCTPVFVRPNYSSTTLTKPIVNASTSGSNVTLTWGACSGATHYWLEMYAYGASTSFINTSIGNVTSYTVTDLLPGTYTAFVQSADSSKSVVSDGVTFTIADKPLDVGTNFFGYIVNVAPWKMLTNDRDNVTIRKEKQFTDDQVWRFERQSDGSYVIRTWVDGKVLGADGASGNVLVKNENSDWIKWYIIQFGDNYEFRNKASGKLLEVAGGETAEGSNVQQWERNNSNAQIFTIWHINNPSAETLNVIPGTSTTPTTFSWHWSSQARNYDLYIYKDGKANGKEYMSQMNVIPTGCSVNLPAGYYEAFVTAVNQAGSAGSAIVSFNVEAVKYEVKYNANGGTGAPGSQTKIHDQVLSLTNDKPSKNYTITYNANGGNLGSGSKTVSCTFRNWNTNANGSGSTYNAGGSYTANAGVTLYAQWSNPTAGNLEMPTRSGYTFAGWYAAESGGSQVTSGTTITGNTTLYAHWNINKYTISYNANGGNGASDSQTKEYNTTLTLSNTKPTRSGYTFLGWSTSSTATSAIYQPGGSYTDDSDVTLYAVWKQNSSAISGNVTSYDIHKNDTVTIRLLNSTGISEVRKVQCKAGNSSQVAYEIKDVKEGNYILEVSKEGHVTRTYEITVGQNSVNQDVKICPIGDVTGDGKVNTRDLNRLYAHVNGTNPLTGYEFDCGDVTGDGKINTRDLNRLYAHISETNLLW